MKLEVFAMVRFAVRALARLVGVAHTPPLVAHNELAHAHWDRELRSWVMHSEEVERTRAA